MTWPQAQSLETIGRLCRENIHFKKTRDFILMFYQQLEHPLAIGWTSPWCNRRSALGTSALGCGTSPQPARSTGPHGGGVVHVTWSSRRGSHWWAVAWGTLASWRGWDRRGSRQSRPERTGWTPEIQKPRKKRKWQRLVVSSYWMCQSCFFVCLAVSVSSLLTTPMVLSLHRGKSDASEHKVRGETPMQLAVTKNGGMEDKKLNQVHNISKCSQ